MDATHGRVYAVVCYKEQKMALNALFYCVQYIHSFIFPEISGRRGLQPP